VPAQALTLRSLAAAGRFPRQRLGFAGVARAARLSFSALILLLIKLISLKISSFVLLFVCANSAFFTQFSVFSLTYTAWLLPLLLAYFVGCHWRPVFMAAGAAWPR
jgi:hypothetical protein